MPETATTPALSPAVAAKLPRVLFLRFRWRLVPEDIMLARCCAPAIVLLLVAVTPASGQTTTTNCTAYGNTLNCQSQTFPSLQQQTDRIEAENQRNWQNLQQSIVNLRMALAQRAAQKAAQEAAWTSAATAQAERQAAVARANFDATTAAMGRFAADTTPSILTPVNTGYTFDWAALNGVESHYEIHGDNHMRWVVTSRIGVTTDRSGNPTAHSEGATAVYFKDQYIADINDSYSYEPQSGVSTFTRVGRPLYATISPIYESSLIVGSHAFARRMNSIGYDTRVPPGTIEASFVPLALQALAGPIPDSLRFWVVNESGTYLPADVTVVKRSERKVPLGAPGDCVDGKTKKVKVRIVTVSIQVGAHFDTLDFLEDSPHLVILKDLTCRAFGSREQAARTGIK